MLTRPDFYLINDLANICAPGTDNNILTSFLVMAFLLSLVCITQGGTKPSSEQDWEITLRFNSVYLCFRTAVLEVGSAYSSVMTSLPNNQAVIEMNGQQPLDLYTVHISNSIDYLLNADGKGDLPSATGANRSHFLLLSPWC